MPIRSRQEAIEFAVEFAASSGISFQTVGLVIRQEAGEFDKEADEMWAEYLETNPRSRNPSLRTDDEAKLDRLRRYLSPAHWCVPLIPDAQSDDTIEAVLVYDHSDKAVTLDSIRHE